MSTSISNGHDNGVPCDTLMTLQSPVNDVAVQCIHPMLPVTVELTSDADYPSPNGVTSDGGMWMTIGTSRF